jgi:hypothetical protein
MVWTATQSDITKPIAAKPASPYDGTSSCASEYFSAWREPVYRSCQIRWNNGYPVPDPRCTPGGINPSITVADLRNPQWRTSFVRNCDT